MTKPGEGMAQADATRTRVVIIGAGFGGIGLAIKLRQDGLDDFVILEKADDVGGVWRDNRYPGAACDVPSHLYSFSFAPRADWPDKYARQPDILAYLKDCVRAHGLEPHIHFGAEVTAARWDEASGRWRVGLRDGRSFEAQALVSATGQLSRPSIPPLPGLERFAGAAFHSANWPQTLDLRGRQVAVIGTGASAIQIVPEIASAVARLFLFQRSAAYVLPKREKRYPRWRQALYRRFPWLLRLDRLRIYLQHEARAFAFVTWRSAMRPRRLLFFLYLRRAIGDPELRKRLTPDYRMGCKRILLSSDYYPAVRRPNVELVTDEIAEITPGGIVTRDGKERTLDCIVFATGFAAADFMAPISVIGRGGQDLRAAWRDGAEAHLGIAVAGFPNFFMLYGPNTNLAHNSIVYMIEAEIGYVIACIRRLARGEARALEVKADVQRRYNAAIQQRLVKRAWSAGCTTWYLDAAGRNVANWPGYSLEFRWRTRAPDWDDYAVQ
jgi:cation diffusion facilitator CzcD-associated flavoprotein CzcO